MDELRLSDVLGALSHALDITSGQPPGHAERTCLIAMRLAQQLELDEPTRRALFYASLVKDAGCSSTGARVAALYDADDTHVKTDRRRTDFVNTPEALVHLVKHVSPGGSPLRKARTLRRMLAFGREGSREIVALRCERGADVARGVGLDEIAATAVLHVDERWDGRGAPDGLQGEEISPAGRILALAQCAAVFWALGGPGRAVEMARRRSGTWFDPQLVDALRRIEPDREFWASLEEPSINAHEPADTPRPADDAQLDAIAEAFARVVDAKSPYTARHSAGVALVAGELAQALALDAADATLLRRAGLLHDIGKLGVSSAILDKQGSLTPGEWAAVRRHPRLSMEILIRVPAFDPLARLAAAHHERLDGSGYWRGLDAAQLDLPARVLAVADVAEALSSDRPYRPALAPDEVLAIMERDAGSKLDAQAVGALAGVLPDLDLIAPSWAPAPTPGPAGA